MLKHPFTDQYMNQNSILPFSKEEKEEYINSLNQYYENATKFDKHLSLCGGVDVNFKYKINHCQAVLDTLATWMRNNILNMEAVYASVDTDRNSGIVGYDIYVPELNGQEENIHDTVERVIQKGLNILGSGSAHNQLRLLSSYNPVVLTDQGFLNYEQFYQKFIPQ